jgi:hypothetical protein
MKRLLVLGILALVLFLPPPDPADAQMYGGRPRRAPARAGGPELAMVVGSLGSLGASAIGAGLYLLRRKSDEADD